MKLYDELSAEFSTMRIIKDYPLAHRTTFKVGGKCDVAVFPSTVAELKTVVDALKGRYPYCVIGNGSNVLVSDKGFKGVVIFTENLKRATLNGNILVAECGAAIKDVIAIAVQNNLSGVEFAVSIPGTIGGLVAMNGGCFNKNISDVVCYVVAENGVFNNKGCNFGYRSSRFTDGEVILSVGLRLKVSEADLIGQKITRFREARSKSQPSGKTCGSVFLNQGYFAGKVIDKAGLKGYRVGGAYVSEKHANFIINEGASAGDIFRLIQFIKDTVEKTQGIALCEEVRYIGDFT